MILLGLSLSIVRANWLKNGGKIINRIRYKYITVIFEYAAVYIETFPFWFFIS